MVFDSTQARGLQGNAPAAGKPHGHRAALSNRLWKCPMTVRPRLVRTFATPLAIGSVLFTGVCFIAPTAAHCAGHGRPDGMPPASARDTVETRSLAGRDATQQVEGMRKRLPDFAKFPAEPPGARRVGAPDLRSHPRAARYRTRLHHVLAQGPAFAGRFAVAAWGCGTGCVERALVDTASGRVFFPDELVTGPAGSCEHDRPVLRYRADSRLIHALRFEGPHAKIEALLWEDTRFRIVGSVIEPVEQWCSAADR